MNKDELINISKNKVGKGEGYGKPNEHSLMTSPLFVYRVTGMDQILDIIECGYVRPKGYGKRFERVGPVVYWSQGGEKHHYDDKRPVIMAKTEKVSDGQIGCISIDDLEAIWMYDEKQDVYIDKLKAIKHIRQERLDEIALAEEMEGKKTI